MTSLIDQITSVLSPFDNKNLQAEIDSITARRTSLKEFREANEHKSGNAFGYYSGMFAAVGGKGWYELLTNYHTAAITEKLTKNHNTKVEARNTKIAKKFDALEITEVKQDQNTYADGRFFGTWVLETNKGRKIVQIEVILAGGYNIQCLHNRILVKVK